MPAHDTPADECAQTFLLGLEEALWLADEMSRTGAHAFPHTTRPTEHIADLRRLLHRLHEVLITWETPP